MRATPHTSVTRVVQEIGISVASAHRILTVNISLSPYKIKMHQALSQVAVGKHLNFAMEFSVYLNAHLSVLPLIWFSDEAHFWLEGYVNKHDCRIRASSNPGIFLTKNLHPKKITVWAALGTQGLISPIFVWKNIDGPVYRKILKKKAFPQFTVMKKFSKFWFQQDGAKAHTADVTLHLIETHFKKRVLSNHFSLKKKGAGAGCHTTPISFLCTISSAAM